MIPPFPVVPTLAPPCPDVPDPDPSIAPNPLNSVSFGLGIAKALPYADIVQETYPTPAISEAGDLASTTRDTTKDIHQAASFQDFVASKQQRNSLALPETVSHPAATLI